jgi:tetratricopeptide (TPR) repeat protein
MVRQSLNFSSEFGSVYGSPEDRRAAGETDKAVADLSEAIRLDPGDVTPYFDRGCAWEIKKEFDRAIADFTEVIRRQPTRLDAYIRRGNSWAAKGEAHKADADFKESARLQQ